MSRSKRFRVALERLDVPPDSIVRLRNEPGNVRKAVIRTYTCNGWR